MESASGAVVVNRLCRSEDGRAGERALAGGVPRRRASCSHRGNCRALMNLKPPPLLPPPPRCRLSSFYSSLFSHHSIQFGNLAPPRKRRRRRANRPSLRPSVHLPFRSLPSCQPQTIKFRSLPRTSVSLSQPDCEIYAPPSYTIHSFSLEERNAANISWRGERRGESSSST